MLEGPENSPYKGGTFKVDVNFPDMYPFYPPTIKFKTTIYHPAISLKTGETSICDPTFWSPAMLAPHLLLIMRCNMSEPDTEHCLNPEIAK